MASMWTSVRGAVTAALLLLNPPPGCGRDGAFCPDACDRMRRYVPQELVGQDFALQQLMDAVCDHLAEDSPTRPLVLSLHGPPGVGKTLFHRLLAQAVYNATDGATACPGAGCPGYRVVFGMDYVAAQQQEQSAQAQAGILQHLRTYPQSLVVIEEYDKMDCPGRAVFKQLMDHGTVGDMKEFRKSIIVLEANVGWTRMQELINHAGSRDKVSMEDAHRELKDKVFSKWRDEKCEDFVDTVKTMSLMSMLVPFMPLEKHDLTDVFINLLSRRERRERLNGNLARLAWTAAVPVWLASKAEYDDSEYTVEGAKETPTIMSRYVSRALRLQQESPPAQWQCADECTADSSEGVWARHLSVVQLDVSKDGSKLEAHLKGTVSGESSNR